MRDDEVLYADVRQEDMMCRLTVDEAEVVRRFLFAKVAMCHDALRDCEKMDPLKKSTFVRDEMREWKQRLNTIELLLSQLPPPIRGAPATKHHLQKLADAKVKSQRPAKGNDCGKNRARLKAAKR